MARHAERRGHLRLALQIEPHVAPDQVAEQQRVRGRRDGARVAEAAAERAGRAGVAVAEGLWVEARGVGQQVGDLVLRVEGGCEKSTHFEGFTYCYEGV